MPDFQRVSWHQQWLALNDEYARQLDIWAVALARLEHQPGWFAMSDVDRDEAERASGLTDTNTRLRLMDRRLRRWLRFLPKAPAQDIEGVIANLQVAEHLLAPEENRIVHGLVVRAARDLSRLKPTSRLALVGTLIDVWPRRLRGMLGLSGKWPRPEARRLAGLAPTFWPSPSNWL